MRRVYAIVIGVGLLVGLTIPLFGSVSAHFQLEYWDQNNQSDWKYFIDSQRNPPFDQNADFYNRALDAADTTFDGVSGVWLDLDHTTPQPQLSRSEASTWSAAGVGIGDVIIADYWKDDSCDPNGNPPACWNWPNQYCWAPLSCVIGENSFRTSGSTWGSWLYGSLIKINEENSINWEYDAGSVGLYEFDLWGVMAHEVGHAMGFAHIDLNCGDTGGGWATMCPNLADHRGKGGARTLTTHEEDDLKNQY